MTPTKTLSSEKRIERYEHEKAVPYGVIRIPQDFSLKRMLGEGSQGKVWLAYEYTTYNGNVMTSNPKPKAWKFIQEYERRKALIREANAVSRFRHENVIRADPLMFVSLSQFPKEFQDYLRKLYSSAKDVDWKNLPVMSMEYIEGFSFGADLSKWFERLSKWNSCYDRRTKTHLMPLHTLGFIISRAARGLDYINSLPMEEGERKRVHKDIKPQNTLIDEQGVVKITDFALSDVEITEGTVIGTLLYMPPEQMMGKKDLTPQADVYSLGMVAYEGMTGGIPHLDMTPNYGKLSWSERVKAFLDNARQGYPELYREVRDIETPYAERLRGELCDLLKSMLEFNPDNRPTPSELAVKLEGIIYKDLPVPGPTNPSLRIQGLLYEQEQFELSSIKPEYIRPLLHLCRDPLKTKKIIDEGRYDSLAPEDYPQIARPLVRKMIDSKDPAGTRDTLVEMRENTESARRTCEPPLPR